MVSPTLTSELHRVFFVKITKPKSALPKFIMQECVNIVELRLREDFSLNEIVFIDMENIFWDEHTKITPMLLFQALAIYRVIFLL